MPSHRLDIGEDGRDIEHRVLRVHLQHEVELIAVPAVEPLLDAQPIENFRRHWLGDAPSLPPSGRGSP
jgi:hypothetical protein